jgi:hypothetical protein
MYEAKMAAHAAATLTQGGSVGGPKENPTLLRDVGILLARIESNEYTAARIAARLFGSQPANQTDAKEAPAGDVLEQDVLRACRSAERTREVLEALEVRLG